MKKILVILIIGLLIGWSLGVQGFSKLNENNTTQFSHCDHFRYLIVDGRIRSYLIHIPPTYDGTESVPVIIVLHGHPSWCMDPKVFTEFDEKANQEGFIVVYPNGHLAPPLQRLIMFLNTLFPTSRIWNCWDYCDIDDMGFIRNLINHLHSTFNIDSSRVFITGLSGGGMMTYRLGADLSDIVAAIAPVAGSIGGIWYTESTQYVIPKPDHPISVIVFHGY